MHVRVGHALGMLLAGLGKSQFIGGARRAAQSLCQVSTYGCTYAMSAPPCMIYVDDGTSHDVSVYS